MTNDDIGRFAPAAPPPGRAAMRMTWQHLLFLHWPVDASLLRPLIPDALTIDTFDGTAWIGLVPFTMRGVRHWWMPDFFEMGGITRFHECNVRTYVSTDGEPGVWFFSLDANAPLAVWGARTFWSLPYQRADITLERRGRIHDYHVHRRGPRPVAPGTRLQCRWRTGEPLPASEPGSIEHFLTERYQLYCSRGDRVRRGRIRHDPWPLRRAELLHLEDGLVAAAGIPAPTGEPIVHAAESLDVRAWGLESLES
jgi:uncharacterized protein YqjF (DUF2071 family)